MLTLRLSIRTLLLALLLLSVLLAILVYRVDTQRKAVVAITDAHGVAFSGSQPVVGSFNSNLWNSVTEIGIPTAESGLEIQNSTGKLPRLAKIVVIKEGDQSKIAALEERFPGVDITHRFYLPYGGDTLKWWKTAR